MRVLWLVIGVLAAAAPLCSMACSPASPDANEALHASFIVRGRAMSSHWIEPSTLIVRVAVKGVVKGNAPNSLEATSPCALPVKDGETVVVFNIDGQSLVYPTEVYEQDIQSALHGARQ